MSKQYINPETLYKTQQYGFSQIVVSNPGKLVTLSGMVGWNAQQEIVGEGDLREQTWQSFRNVAAGMQAAGGTLADVVSLRIYIVESHLENNSCVTDALKEFFPADKLPATTWIGVQALANPIFLIEIEAMGIIE